MWAYIVSSSFRGDIITLKSADLFYNDNILLSWLTSVMAEVGSSFHFPIFKILGLHLCMTKSKRSLQFFNLYLIENAYMLIW